MVCAVHTNISCHIPHEHYTCCVTLPILMTTAGFSDTHRVSCPPSPHQSVSHTHCLCHHPHSHTGLVIHLQESLHPIRLKDSGTHRTNSLSTIPRNPGCHRHLHTHTHSPIIPPINHTVTSGNHHASYRYIIERVCHSRHLCHTDCGHSTPQTQHSLLPMLWGLQPVASPKSPIFSSIVFQ